MRWNDGDVIFGFPAIVLLLRSVFKMFERPVGQKLFKENAFSGEDSTLTHRQLSGMRAFMVLFKARRRQLVLQSRRNQLHAYLL